MAIATRSPQPEQTRRRGWAPLLLALAGTLAALLCAEAALRLIKPLGSTPLLPLAYHRDTLERIMAGQTLVRFDAELGWTLLPGAEQLGMDVWYRVNRAGLRADREYEARPRPGTRRLLAYGDSFTFCEEVELEDCWSSRLERLWPRTEVLNRGVMGYAPDQAFLLWQRDAPAYGACAVLIGHLTENVNRVVNRFRPFYLPDTGIALAKPRFVVRDGEAVLLPSGVERAEQLLDPAWVERELGPGDDWYFPGLFVANPLDMLEVARVARSAAYRRRAGEAWSAAWSAARYRPGEPAFEVTVAVLRAFARDVRARGATPVVLVFPTREELEVMRRSGERPYGALVQALRAEGLAVVDLGDRLVEQARGTALGSLVGNHYRPLGNQVVARKLASDLPKLTAATCGEG